jgi:hypothetical protein
MNFEILKAVSEENTPYLHQNASESALKDQSTILKN